MEILRKDIYEYYNGKYQQARILFDGIKQRYNELSRAFVETLTLYNCSGSSYWG